MKHMLEQGTPPFLNIKTAYRNWSEVEKRPSCQLLVLKTRYNTCKNRKSKCEGGMDNDSQTGAHQ